MRNYKQISSAERTMSLHRLKFEHMKLWNSHHLVILP